MKRFKIIFYDTPEILEKLKAFLPKLLNSNKTFGKKRLSVDSQDGRPKFDWEDVHYIASIMSGTDDIHLLHEDNNLPDDAMDTSLNSATLQNNDTQEEPSETGDEPNIVSKEYMPDFDMDFPDYDDGDMDYVPDHIDMDDLGEDLTTVNKPNKNADLGTSKKVSRENTLEEGELTLDDQQHEHMDETQEPANETEGPVNETEEPVNETGEAEDVWIDLGDPSDETYELISEADELVSDAEEPSGELQGPSTEVQESTIEGQVPGSKTQVSTNGTQEREERNRSESVSDIINIHQPEQPSNLLFLNTYQSDGTLFEKLRNIGPKVVEQLRAQEGNGELQTSDVQDNIVKTSLETDHNVKRRQKRGTYTIGPKFKHFAKHIDKDTPQESTAEVLDAEAATTTHIELETIENTHTNDSSTIPIPQKKPTVTSGCKRVANESEFRRAKRRAVDSKYPERKFDIPKPRPLLVPTEEVSSQAVSFLSTSICVLTFLF